jgi:purine-binding chemotaxis protein CheW
VIVLALDDRTVGIVVDGVSDVVRLELEDIKEPPGIKFSQECSIVGMATQDERMVMVLDIDATLAGNAKGLEDVVGAAVNSAAFVASA